MHQKAPPSTRFQWTFNPQDDKPGPTMEEQPASLGVQQGGGTGDSRGQARWTLKLYIRPKPNFSSQKGGGGWRGQNKPQQLRQQKSDCGGPTSGRLQKYCRGHAMPWLLSHCLSTSPYSTSRRRSGAHFPSKTFLRFQSFRQLQDHATIISL